MRFLCGARDLKPVMGIEPLDCIIYIPSMSVQKSRSEDDRSFRQSHSTIAKRPIIVDFIPRISGDVNPAVPVPRVVPSDVPRPLAGQSRPRAQAADRSAAHIK
jgi:hypothetical protein